MAGQVWGTQNLGGYMGSPLLSKILRTAVQPTLRFRSLCDVKDASMGGLGRGDTFNWNVYSDVAVAGASLAETSVMPETNFTIHQESITMTEYGNSVPYTGKLDNLSVHPVTEIINKVLKNDCKKALDKAAYDQFNATPLRVAPVGGTDVSAVSLSTTGSTAITNNVAMTADHVKAISDLMKERNIPGFSGEDYVCVAHPTTLRGFKNELEDLKKYTGEGFSMILNGEVGRYESVRFVEQTNIAKEGWTNGKSNQAFFIGGDTVAEAVAVPEEIRGKIPQDYGRDKGIAWYALLGFGIVHTQAAQARIIKWDSAA